jgi:integrase
VHLQRRGGIYEFRRRVPKELRFRWGRRELTRSLRTADKVSALRAARRLSVAADAVFNCARNMPDLTHEQLDELAYDYFEKALRESEAELAAASPHRALYTDPGPGERAIEADQKALSTIEDMLIEELVEGDYSRIAPEVHPMLGRAGVEETTDDEQFRSMAQRVLRANLEVIRMAYRQRAGDYGVEPRDPLFRRWPLQRGPQRKPASSRLSEVAEAFVRAKERDEGWAPLTKANHEPKLKRFIEILGDKPIDMVTREDIRGWRDELSKRQGLAASTIAQDFKVIGGMFTWAKREGMATIDSPLSGLSPKRSEGGRKAFQPEDLKRLFHSPLYMGHLQRNIRTQPGRFLVKDHKYWFPPIALFSGLRVEEIAKLKVCDVRQIDGVWCFDVYDTKTQAGNRRVPVHPRLSALGFLDYVKAQEQERLWHKLRAGSSGKFSHYFSQWWTNFRRKVGLGDEGLVFHSFRHTFASALQSAMVPRDMIALLIGHEDENFTTRVYGGKLVTTQQLLELIEGVDFGVDLTHLLENSAERRTAPRHRGATAPVPSR